MTSLAIECFRASLAFRAPVQIGDVPTKRRESLLVRVTDGVGRSGWGEVAPLTGFFMEELDAAASALRSARLLPMEQATPNAVRRAVLDALGLRPAQIERGGPTSLPATRAALETALADLSSRRIEQPLARFLSTDARRSVAVNALATDATAATLEAAAERAVARGITTLKVKVGRGPESDERAAIDTLIERFEGLGLRLDPNQRWDVETTRRWVAAYPADRLEYVEQPVSGDRVETLIALAEKLPGKIAADESLVAPGGLGRLRAADVPVHLVLKPQALGGPITALRIAYELARGGTRVTVTTMLDSAIGRMMATHVASVVSALQTPPGAHGLDTGDLLAQDVATTPPCHNGLIAIPDRAGLGIDPDEAAGGLG